MVRRQKMGRSEWWFKRISFLKGTEDEAKKLFEKTQKAYEKQGLWPLLKLSALSYYLPAYLQIISKHYEKIYYIDVCSSCGLVKIQKRLFLGSALLAERSESNAGNRSFDGLFFIDNDEEACNALSKIVDQKRSQVICGDANNELPSIIQQIEQNNKSHFVCFVDPEGMEISWNTIELLLRARGDIIINYMCAGIARNFHNPKIMNTFFGDSSWQDCKDGSERHECLFNIYLKKIQSLKPVTIDVKIKSEKSFHYHIIFAFVKSGWEHIISDVKKKIECVTLQEIENYLDIQEHKQKTLI